MSTTARRQITSIGCLNLTVITLLVFVGAILPAILIGIAGLAVMAIFASQGIAAVQTARRVNDWKGQTYRAEHGLAARIDRLKAIHGDAWFEHLQVTERVTVTPHA
jgi:hypothetical protein